MSIRITIEHGGGKFRRQIHIDRAVTQGRGYDARHVYSVLMTGGLKIASASFEHRYGDPLDVLFIEAVAALKGHPEADPELYDENKGID